MDSEAVPGVMQARALLAGRSADACTSGDAQEGGDDCAVRAGAVPLIDEEGRFWISAVTVTTSGRLMLPCTTQGTIHVRPS